MNTDRAVGNHWAYVLLIVFVALLAFFVGGQLWSGVLFLTHGFLVLMEGPLKIPSLPTGLCGTIAIGCAACGW